MSSSIGTIVFNSYMLVYKVTDREIDQHVRSIKHKNTHVAKYLKDTMNFNCTVSECVCFTPLSKSDVLLHALSVYTSRYSVVRTTPDKP